jgi:hypothetical protein
LQAHSSTDIDKYLPGTSLPVDEVMSMDFDSMENEIQASIVDVLKSKGVDANDIKIKAKTKGTVIKSPVKPQGIVDKGAVVEWPDARCTVVTMKLKVKFVTPASQA